MKVTVPLWISFYLYICVCLLNRFLIFKLLIKRLIITNAGIAPSGTMGLRKPPGSLPLLPLSLLASVWTPKTCDLTQEKCNFPNQTLSIQPLNEKRLFQEYKQWLWFAFGKSRSTHLPQWEGASSTQLWSEQAAMVRPSLSNGLRSPVRHVREGRTH